MSDGLDFPGVLGGLIQGRDLAREEAGALMSLLMSGTLHDAQIGGILVALAIKGVRPAELAGFAHAMRESAAGLDLQEPRLVDTCGTGGGSPSFNLSTGAAIVAAAAGAKVAKHGNRAVTSRCGSADVLEALGVNLAHDRLPEVFRSTGLVFMFAPLHHVAMKHVGPARRALGVRTVFNQLGPLANPAGARRQVVGVFSDDLVRPMAEALSLLGAEYALVVNGVDGLDEVSPVAPTHYAMVRQGTVAEGKFVPEDFDMHAIPASALQPGSTAGENAEILREALSQPGSPRSAALVPNAAVALMLAGIAGDTFEGARMARAAIDEGRAAQTLERLVQATVL